VGAVKAEQDLVDLVCKKFPSISLSETLYVDDREQNLSLSKEKGCTVSYFTTYQKFKKELKKLGVAT
jgi:hypothetical protein